MVAILEKGEFNSDFHPMVDFIAASPLRYALTVKPAIFVSHIRQFWSTARIETTDEGTHILAIMDGIQRTVSESSLRHNLKLRDEDCIVSIPDTKLFENLTLIGYNISQNQKLTFQKGQFFHQWKYLIHTIMQCLSPKSTRFNEFSSNIATALISLATNRTYHFSKMIFDGMVKNVNNKISKFLMYPSFLTICLRMSQFSQITHTHQYVGEGSGTPTEPHHTPSPEADTSHPTTSSIPLPSLPTAPIPPVTQTDTTNIRKYSRRARIAQSFALPTVADEPASLVRDVSKGEACLTESGFIADQDRATIAKSSTLPHDSTPRVTSPAADEGSMQQTISELTALCTSLQRQHSELLAQFQAREVEILRLKERVQVLEDRESVAAKQSGDDDLIKERSINEGEAAAERISNDSEEIARVLTSMDAATVLAGGIDVPTGSGSIPTAGPPATVISTGSKVSPTASPIVTSYLRRKGKEVMVESDTPKKQILQEHIDAQVTRELEEQQEKEDMRINEQIARDEKVARIHAKEELQGMIDSLDRFNEFSSNIATALVSLATNRTYNFSKMIFDGMVKNGEGSGTPTEPHHTPSPEADTSHPTTSSIPLPSLPTAPIPPVTQTDTTHIRKYSRRARIAQSFALLTVADEPASLVRDVNKGEACPTESGFIADQDRATIAKSSTLPHDSTPRVTSPAADEGSMQQTISELTALCTSLQRQHSELLAQFQAREMEILRLKERVQVLEDRESVAAKQSGDDDPIKERSINEGEEAAERISNDSEEIARVLTSMDAATVLAGGIDVPTGSGSIPTVGPPATVISTGSKVGPTASPIVTSFLRRKGKEVMVESDTSKKQILQEHINAQVTRELEEQQEKEDMRINEQISRDEKVARIHAKEELQGMIDSLDRSNETIAKYLQEYQEFASELPLEKRIDMTFEEIEAKFAEVWKKVEDFIPMGSKEEAKRLKRKGLNLQQEQVKKQKSLEDAPEIEKSTKEKMKEMMQLV
nr:synaptobrevin, longin-like domain protein [Tanacetum cinerariifolium]